MIKPMIERRLAEKDRRQQHLLDECPQGPTITMLVDSTKRVAEALENIAAQGVAVASHEKRLDKNDKEHDEIFPRLRKLEDHVAFDKGKEVVKDERKKFWTEAKLKLLPTFIVILFFICWLAEQSINPNGILSKLASEFVKMTGGK